MDKYDPNFIPEHARFLLGVKILVVNKDDNFLVLRRSDKVTRPGGWDFPGGGVEKGENPSLTAVRELREETGLTASQMQIITTFLANTEGEDDLIIGYVTKVDEQQVKITGWEHDEFEWVTLEKLMTLELPDEHMSIVYSYTP